VKFNKKLTNFDKIYQILPIFLKKGGEFASCIDIFKKKSSIKAGFLEFVGF